MLGEERIRAKKRRHRDRGEGGGRKVKEVKAEKIRKGTKETEQKR